MNRHRWTQLDCQTPFAFIFHPNCFFALSPSGSEIKSSPLSVFDAFPCHPPLHFLSFFCIHEMRLC